jgi:hypothetical protein
VQVQESIIVKTVAFIDIFSSLNKIRLFLTISSRYVAFIGMGYLMYGN